MHVHIEGGGVLCNILSSACLHFFPSQLLLSCIYSQFIPSFSSSGSNDTIYVGFAARSLLVPKNKEAKCQILLTFHGLLLLKNRRGRETTARLVGFSRQGWEFGWPALLKRRVVEMNTLNWAQWPEDVVPNVNVGEQHEVASCLPMV